ncbi:AraC family transcriptional regulator [Paenibacillus sp. S-38]|uniref:AraC family transcriptional regulator n=1 Tax=Paenibacillus sp. S-38 TaxID=3416710 RepID=UPI003CF6B906
MPLVTTNYSEIPLQFAYKRKSVNYEHKETFHSHLGVELLLIHEGKGTMIVNNVRYDIKPGMLCIFQPYQLHHLQLEYADNQCFERSMAIFEPTMFEVYFEKWPSLHAFFKYIFLGKLPFPCLYVIEDLAILDSVFRNMHDQWPHVLESEQYEEISLFLVVLFRALKQLWDKLNVHAGDYQTRRKNHQVENILNWIESHYTVPYRLDEMAKSLHLSPYHLSHLFKEATGISISEYITTRRIHQSILLLTNTNKPISFIAEEIGLMSPSYFCKVFKSHMGLTPHQYRKRWAGPSG